MFAKFFSTTEVDAYADWVVAELKRSLPANFDPNLKNVADRVNHVDQVIANKTAGLIGSANLNIYKKARLASRVREGMGEHGYPAKFIDTFTMDLIKRIEVSSRKKA